MLRALARDDAPAEALLTELNPAAGAHPGLDRALSLLRTELRDPAPEQGRRVAELIVRCLQGSLLLRHSPAVVAEAFLESRFGGDITGCTLGVLPAGTDTRVLVERVTPPVG